MKMFLWSLAVVSTLLTLTAQAERESVGVPGPKLDAVCESADGGVSVRIMRVSPYKETKIVVLHLSTLLPFEEVVSRQAQEPGVVGGSLVYKGRQTDLAIYTTATSIHRGDKILHSAKLRTLPYSGELDLVCELVR